MILTRRLALAVSLALGGLVSLVPTTGAELFPAGNDRVTTLTADAFSFTGYPDYTQASVFVQDTVTQANPQGGPSSLTTVVQVSLYWSGNGSAGNGCSVLTNPGDFTSGATGASLQTTFTGSEQPCDQFQPVLPPVSVSATWTSGPSAGSGRTSSRYSCGGYSSESLTTTSNLAATATFSISAIGGSFTDSEASLRSSAESAHAQGTLASTCIQPGGKGAGPGPQAPGRYTFNSMIASFSPSQTDQTDPHVNVFVNRFTNTSNPQGGAPSTSSETDMFINVSGSAGFGFACFVLQPPATFSFNSNLSAATLHISLDSSTPTCQPSFGSFPFLPTDVNVTWTGVGPVAASHSDSQGSCSSFSEQTFFDDTNNNATATATLSYFAGTTFSGGQSFLGTSNHSFQIQGATRCPGAQ